MRTGKRVLMLSTVHHPGQARYHGKLAVSLHEAGFQVESWSQGLERPSFLPKEIRVRLIGLPGKLKRMTYLYAETKRMLFGNDHLVLIVPPETIFAGLLAKLAGKKVIWDVEEHYSQSILTSDWIPPRFRPFLSKAYQRFEKLGCRYFDAITYAEDSYKPRFSSAKRTEAIHNYPWKSTDLGFSTGSHADRRWAHKGPRLLYVGKITRHHGVADVIKAVTILEEELPDIQFDVVGRIPFPNDQAKLDTLRLRLKTPERVRFHGRVPFNELSDYFRDAQIGMFPLWNEPNFTCSEATKLFEYCLHGLPIVTGDIPAWRKLIDAADSGETYEPGNPENMARAIRALWARGLMELRQAGERANREVYRREAFWEYDAEKLVRLCNSVIAQ